MTEPEIRFEPARMALAALLTLLLPATAMSQSPGPSASGDAARPPAQETRPRAREIGLEVGIFEPGPRNAITDVEGVLVGQTTVWEGRDVRTGVTAIRPHPGNVFREKVPAAIHVGNGFGKLAGVTQVRELGEIETPILLTCTLCVWRAADALVAWALEQEGMEEVRSINPVVGETNDGGLNDIRSRPITPEHVRSAITSADGGAVEEGSVGAGTGTRAFGWKGGIGTSSRVLPPELGGWRVGVLVQSNFGGILTMNGAPVGRELGRYAFREVVEGGDGPDDQGAAASEGAGGRRPATEARPGAAADPDQGSIMMVVATDAPLSDRNLERLARRAIMGLARTGSYASNGSGDYVIAFSNHPDVLRRSGEELHRPPSLANGEMSGLFQAVVETTEEAVYNSLLKATTVTGRDGNTADALPVQETIEVLRRHDALSDPGAGGFRE